MNKLSIIIAAAGVMCALPALASPEGMGSMGPGEQQQHRGGYGYDHRGSGGYGYDREDRDRDIAPHMRRFGAERGQALREGCKYITVRQRQGDEIIVRHFKHCE